MRYKTLHLLQLQIALLLAINNAKLLRRIMTEPTEELRVPCEVYSRIVGYLRPVQHWNTAKQLEFKERVVFKTPDIVMEEKEEKDHD